MKNLVRILVGLLLLLIAAAVVGVFMLDSLVREAVERGGSYALGVPTELASADIGLVSGEFELGRLRVANPAGYKQPDFLSVRTTRLELPLSALREERITVPLLEIEGIALDLERNATGTNYGVILENLKRLETGAPAPPAEKGKAFVVQRLVVRDVHASIDLVPALGAVGDLTKLSLSIPEVVVEELGSDMTVAQLCAVVVKTILNAALQQGAGKLPEEFLADLRSRLQGLEGLDDQMLDRAQDALDEAADDLQGKLEGKLNDLLKKKK
jgi:hypothetical protein